MNWKRVVIRCLIFACGGLLGEMFYHSILAGFQGNWNLHGHSSPWMMPDYALLGILVMPISRYLVRWGLPLPARAFVYGVLIYVVEYISGLFFTEVVGLQIWSYANIPYNLHGQIMLYSAPGWYILGLVAEYLNRKIDAVAVLLLRGITAEELESWVKPTPNGLST